MDIIRRNAATAGLLYLLLVLIAPIRLVYIPERLFVVDDIAATAANIAANAQLFQLGILGEVFCATLEVFLALALYRLFRAVHRPAALLMLVLGLMPVPLYFVNVFNDVAIVHVLETSGASGPDAQGLGLIALAMRLHDAGIHMLQIFWSAWLFPLALLAYRSGWMPRLVGVWLGVNGVSYLALSLAGFVRPDLTPTVALLAVPAQLGEVVFTVCLLWRGLRGVKAARLSPVESLATA